MIVFAGLAVAVVGGNLLWWALLHRPYAYHSDSSSVRDITWSRDGKLIAFTTSSDNGQKPFTSTLRVWEFATNENLFIYSNSSSFVGNIAWSPDSKYLAFTTVTHYSGGSSTSTAQVWVWDAITKAKVSLSTYTSTGSPSALIDWSPDSKYLAFTISTHYSGGSSTSTAQTSTAQVWVWDAITKAKVSLSTSTGSPSAYTDWSPDGKYLAFTTVTNPSLSSTSTAQTSTAQVWVWDAITKAKVSLSTSTGSSFFGSGSRSEAEITWSHDGKYLAFTISTDSGGSSTNTEQKGTVQVRVWDAIAKANLFIYTYPYTGSFSFRGRGNYFGSGSPSYKDITWSTDDKHLAFVINRIDPSCETISNSCNGTVYIWDATIKSSTYVLRLGSSAVDEIAWSPDNARIASVSSGGTLYVWYSV